MYFKKQVRFNFTSRLHGLKARLPGHPHTTTVKSHRACAIYPTAFPFHARIQPSLTWHLLGAAQFISVFPLNRPLWTVLRQALARFGAKRRAASWVFPWLHWLQRFYFQLAHAECSTLILSHLNCLSIAEWSSSEWLNLPQRKHALIESASWVHLWAIATLQFFS